MRALARWLGVTFPPPVYPWNLTWKPSTAHGYWDSFAMRRSSTPLAGEQWHVCQTRSALSPSTFVSLSLATTHETPADMLGWNFRDRSRKSIDIRL